MKRILIILAMLVLPILSFAKDSDWVELQTVVIPQDTKVYEGTTKSGNQKFWIVIGKDTKVSVSKSNAEKLQKGEEILLIKWQNQTTKKIRYSTRSLRGASRVSIEDLDLNKVFKKGVI